MDSLTILGVLLAAVVVAGGQAMDGRSLSVLLNFPAFLIVFGGTFSAVLIQTPVRVLRHTFKLLPWALRPYPQPTRQLINELVSWSQLVQQKGLVALDKKINLQTDPFMKKALEFMSSGCDVGYIKRSLQVEIDKHIERDLQGIYVLESLGGYAPTIGIIGAVLGLIEVMGRLSHPDEIGIGIAVAFVATVYGIGLANFCFIPLAQKLRISQQTKYRKHEMVLDSMVYILEGASPALIRRQLSTYI